jgi:excisionase family DNA binding protein
VTASSAPPAAAGRTSPLGEPLVDAGAVAAYLSVDPATVYRLVERGALPAIRIAPRVMRFRPEDVRSYLAQNTRKAAPAGRVKRLLGGAS